MGALLIEVIAGLLVLGGPMLAAAYVAVRLCRRQVATRTWIKYVTVMLSAVVTTALAIFVISLCGDGRQALTVGYWTGAEKIPVQGWIAICLFLSCIAIVPSIGILVRY